MIMRKLAIVLLLGGCASVPQPEPCNPGLSLVNASAWVATAAEYDASAIQVYNNARRQLDAALAVAGDKPPAIILDLDETSLDNVAFEGRMIRQGITYEQKAWNQWVSESKAVAVPGAAEFLTYAKSRGVTPFYITNRLAAEEPGTLRNLQNLGFPIDPAGDALLVRGERPEWQPGDKGIRREYVAARYRVLLVLGDDLNDFVNAVDKSREERDALVRTNNDLWGSRWLILPNPMYGSWERALTRGGKSPCEELQRKIDAVPY
jgi:5'-nucleotidase (lipoprotein e(P4) family)